MTGTKLFDLNDAAKHPEWLKEARIGEHTPETDEYGISSFTFRASRPFHPARLHAAGELMAKREGALRSLVRGKGIVWLATEASGGLQNKLVTRTIVVRSRDITAPHNDHNCCIDVFQCLTAEFVYFCNDRPGCISRV